MKKIFLMAIAAMMAMADIQAQNIPVGMRMEIAESEQDHAEYTIFSYKDDENTFGYYLSLGRIFWDSYVMTLPTQHSTTSRRAASFLEPPPTRHLPPSKP